MCMDDLTHEDYQHLGDNVMFNVTLNVMFNVMLNVLVRGGVARSRACAWMT